MNDNDKILMNAYLDGETNSDESNYVESLIENDKDANKYMNNIKKVNIEINSFFKSSEINDLKLKIDDLHSKNKKKSQFKFLDIFSMGSSSVGNGGVGKFSSSLIPVTALSFVIIVSIILVPSLNNQYSNIYTYNYSETRSDTQESFDEIFEDVIFDMESKEITESKLQFMDISMIIKLEPNDIAFSHSRVNDINEFENATTIYKKSYFDNNQCIKGEVEREDTKQKRVFEICKN